MALGEAEEDIQTLRRAALFGADIHRVKAKIDILEGAHYLLDRDVISKSLYMMLVNELLLKDIALEDIPNYAGLI